MSAVVSLELVFDEEAESAIRREWRLLHDAGLPSQAQHTGASNRPHTTLLVRTALPEIDAERLDRVLPVAVTLGAPVLFGVSRTRVLARSVVPSGELLALHAAVHGLAGPGDDAPHTMPGEWTPHVTLARRVPVGRIGEAVDALGAGGGEPIRAWALGIRRWDAETRTVSPIAGRGTLESC